MLKFLGLVIMTKKEWNETIDKLTKEKYQKEQFVNEIKEELEFRRKEEALRKSRNGEGSIVLWD